MGRTLVTGGAKGLGAEICRTLSSAGHQLLIHYNKSEKEALELADACYAEIIQGDFSSQEGVEVFIKECKERFPTIGSLVNNVGNYLIKSSFQTTSEELTRLYQTNVLAPFMITQSLCVTDSIVNIGVAGLHERADTYSSAYTMTKAALLQWTRSLAKELALKGVSVNMVSPGYIEGSVDLPELEKLPMKRSVRREEVARLVAFLLDQRNRSITGQNIEIAGGVRL